MPLNNLSGHSFQKSLVVDLIKSAMISKVEWDVITRIACDIVNYTIAEDEIAAGSKKKDILKELNRLRTIHGDEPSTIHALGLYTQNSKRKIRFFKLSYQISIRNNEFNDALDAANSAFDFCMEMKLTDRVIVWRERVESLLSHATDRESLDEARRLLDQ